MITRGRSIYTNSKTAANLTRYLLDNPKNERAVFLGCHGTAFSDDLEKSIQQMIWRAEDSKSQKPLYFTALSPDLNVDKTLTEEDWEYIRYTQAKHLGLEGQPYAWVQHEKIGRDGQLRIHRHVVYQRYDAETETVISDEYDRRKNRLACAEIEEKLGHDRTFQRWTLEEIKERELQAEQQTIADEEKLRQQETMQEFFVNSAEVEAAPDLLQKLLEVRELERQELAKEPDQTESLYDRIKRKIELDRKKGWSH